MHRNSALLFSRFGREHIRPGMRVLEIGPDGFPSTYRQLTGDPSVVWHTLDLGSRKEPRLDHHSADEYTFPISDGAYDLVLSGQVIEHVRKVWVWIREVARVCRVGGTVITIAPVSWPYHEAPIDCWRLFPEAMRTLYAEAQLDVILAHFDSLELPQKRKIPGMSPEWQSSARRAGFRVLGKLGFPVECAFDTIAIGRRRA